jgi:two-component system sensor histidine kinase ChiS
VDVVEKNIHIAFKDDGPGVPTSVTANLFQKFYRNPNNPTETRGTGLGLYICKQIIDAHHGEIFAESEPSKGVTFHILLPIPANIQERGV